MGNDEMIYGNDGGPSLSGGGWPSRRTGLLVLAIGFLMTAGGCGVMSAVDTFDDLGRVVAVVVVGVVVMLVGAVIAAFGQKDG
ncbi:MAG: hypothetical protein U0W40_17235 [Acidimicrobiia bacterium]